MNSDQGPVARKRPWGKTILWVLGILLLLLIGTGLYLYANFNKLLSNALRKSFNNSLVSDVYALQFSDLSVNFLSGNISVHDVDLRPLEKSVISYPYINSSMHMKAGKILLGNVQIKTLLRENILILDQIELIEPEIDFNITDATPIFFPFKDTASAEIKQPEKRKKSIEQYFLKSFSLVNAAFRVSNTAARRQFAIEKINIGVKSLLLDQRPGIDVFSYEKVDFSIGKLTGSMPDAGVPHIRFKDYRLSIDSLFFQKTKDTVIFKFADLKTGIRELNMDTRDSLFNLSVLSFDLSYKDKSLKTQGLTFKPNISEAALQARKPFQHAQVSGIMGSMQAIGVNFDSLIFEKKLYVNELQLKDIDVHLYKDKTKPIDKKRFPVYLGQTIRDIGLPLRINKVTASNLSLTSKEKKPKGGFTNIHIKRGKAEIKNITNLRFSDPLSIEADAYLENKAHFSAQMQFSYTQPQFSFQGRMYKLNLTELNPLIKSFAPAQIHKGQLDDLSFAGTAGRSQANGTMTFLYHDLDVELELKEKEEWKNSFLSFAANTVLPSANPKSANHPVRTVSYSVERDMNKGFINLLIKSLLAGLKETMIMSKENRQEFRKSKKEMRKEKRDKRRAGSGG